MKHLFPIYHAYHEAGHVLVALATGLTPRKVWLRTGGGGITFCSPSALLRVPDRYLEIAVAGRVATRLTGYKNRLVSEQIARLGDREPGWMSDAFLVWERRYALDDIRAAERRVRAVLRRRLPALQRVAEGLVTTGQLSTSDIRRLIGSSRTQCLSERAGF
jgi:hypothetical protein